MTDQRRRRMGIEVLLAVVRNRTRMGILTPAEWDALLPAADQGRILPRLAIEAEQVGLTTALPDWARDRLASARTRGRAYERAVRWEIDRIHRALLPIGVRPVFLKGAGYIAAGLPCGVGRVVADVDILVAEVDIPRVETALKVHGWEFEPLDAYDERYYREWMHELPPMRHRERGTLLDVHHRILPRTGRIHPPTQRLLDRAIEVGATRVLSPEHMVLHSAAHLFQDGEVAGALRDLVDIHDLVSQFSRDPAFWDRQFAEAEALGLGRPLFYSLRYAQRVCGTPVPDTAWAALDRFRPPSRILAIVDALVGAAVSRPAGRLASPAALALYVRSHWLRMPATLLSRHLWNKWSRRV